MVSGSAARKVNYLSSFGLAGSTGLPASGAAGSFRAGWRLLEESESASAAEDAGTLVTTAGSFGVFELDFNVVAFDELSLWLGIKRITGSHEAGAGR